MKELFFETKITWLKVIGLAIITAVVTAVVLVVPVFEGTSFYNMGVCFEFWFLPALFLALNCEKPLEAGLKTFVFFLISQPLIYLFQVPFNVYGFEILRYYQKWIIPTILTFLGGIVLDLVKEKDWIGLLCALLFLPAAS